MDNQLLLICLLTFSIHLIGALAYAARIAGVRTRRIAVSFALFNVLVLVSRLSNSFLGPFLAKRIEIALAAGQARPCLANSGSSCCRQRLLPWSVRSWSRLSNGGFAAQSAISRSTGQ